MPSPELTVERLAYHDVEVTVLVADKAIAVLEGNNARQVTTGIRDVPPSTSTWARSAEGRQMTFREPHPVEISSVAVRAVLHVATPRSGSLCFGGYPPSRSG